MSDREAVDMEPYSTDEESGDEYEVADLMQDLYGSAREWDGDTAKLDYLEHGIRQHMKVHDFPAATELLLVLLQRDIPAFYRARFNYFIAISDPRQSPEDRLFLAFKFLDDAESIASSEERQKIEVYRQAMLRMKGRLVEKEPVSELNFEGPMEVAPGQATIAAAEKARAEERAAAVIQDRVDTKKRTQKLSKINPSMRRKLQNASFGAGGSAATLSLRPKDAKTRPSIFDALSMFAGQGSGSGGKSEGGSQGDQEMVDAATDEATEQGETSIEEEGVATNEERGMGFE